MPNITSNADGSVTVEFDTPNFNTTWLVQAVAYNSSLATAKWQKNMMTNKPIMVKANAPRFLRTGDITTMAASVQNVSDATQQVSAVIEVVNPRTNEVLSSKTYSLNIESMATEAVKIDYDVPADLPFVALRVKAANATNGDGEQVMIPILTDISPVIETKPFYINAGEGTFSTEMPDMPSNSRVTLEYCDNPVWYCVTALPTILNEDAQTVTSLVHNLFALTLAKGIAESNPEIKTAVDYWTSHPQDSTLMSMLEKNKDLKVGTLLASPWINDAERQTLRMSKLNELFDNNIQSKNTNTIISKLQSLQMSDGGFKWFNCSWCSSSLWTTGEVLEVIGYLRQLGYLTNDARIEQMVKNALKFYDTETYANFLRDNSKHPEYYSGYVYVRSMYSSYDFAGKSKDLYNKALKAMTTTWKDRAIADKAFYALALNRGGYPNVARNIMESVRQFAIVHPTRGMYWDNINLGSGRGFRKVTTTSFVLQAFKEISYRTNEIDQIRKWMLLEKQSNDWGGSSLAADAVYSLMLTGTNWTRKGEMPQIAIGGKTVEFDQMENYLGYGRRTISASTSGESLVINRGQSQSPAWGSVYCQYKGKMTNIESAKTDDISIEKEYLRYDENGNLSKADTFRVGDKVQVRCIIHTGKSAQYLTLTDERASCFEPMDKVSDGKVQDGVYYYLEVKDSSTNSFFYQLEKGTFVVGYEVYVTMPGTFTSGIATIQSQYAPQITAHSAGTTITVLP
ncbi:MAG: hypothetical protein HUK12_09475 [Muribaculaceae bacterium]|nr:hypothetical protein [Muribaculaceae bacterium]